MENFFIKGSEETPTVSLNADTGIMEISESSYPEYTNEIYNPLLEWMEEYMMEPNRKVTFNFRLDYFNTSTSFRFQQIINLLNDYFLNKNGQVVVNWFYQDGDIDMQENGEDYAKDAKMPFNLVVL
ncbi:MAG: DUF1987 domain-containing protein [Bacteroidetes bacterium]|jgi:hypothetical protein|nr:MAG: DUF1987 domain-containing protein [Bacteroidota bacterium]